MTYVNSGLIGAPWVWGILGDNALPPPGDKAIWVKGLVVENPNLGMIYGKVPGASPGSHDWVWFRFTTYDQAVSLSQQKGFTIIPTTVEAVHNLVTQRGGNPYGRDVWFVLDNMRGSTMVIRSALWSLSPATTGPQPKQRLFYTVEPRESDFPGVVVFGWLQKDTGQVGVVGSLFSNPALYTRWFGQVPSQYLTSTGWFKDEASFKSWAKSKGYTAVPIPQDIAPDPGTAAFLIKVAETFPSPVGIQQYLQVRGGVMSVLSNLPRAVSFVGRNILGVPLPL